MSDSALSVGLKARPDSSAVEHLTYKVKGCEFKPRLGQLFCREPIFGTQLRLPHQFFAPSMLDSLDL